MSDLTGKTITADLAGKGWDPHGLRHWAKVADDVGKGGWASLFRYLADQIDEQHPPRMDEPDEFGAMVEAGTQVPGEKPRERRRMLRCKAAGAYRWTDDRGRVYRWSELIDPRPVD
jgi:hypothetical protein